MHGRKKIQGKLIKFVGILWCAVLLSDVGAAQTVKKKPVKKAKPAPMLPAPMTAVMQDGRTVILKPDGKWEFSANPLPKRDSVVVKKPSEAAALVLKELRKMQAATEIGITFQEYRARMIDLKAAVDEGLRSINEEELKREARLALEAYTDALDLWNRQTNSRYPLKQSGDLLREEAKDICEKYGVKEFAVATSGVEIVNSKKVISFIWTFAKTSIEKAEAANKP